MRSVAFDLARQNVQRVRPICRLRHHLEAKPVVVGRLRYYQCRRCPAIIGKES